MESIPFALSSYRSASLPVSSQSVQNFYCEMQRQGMDATAPAPMIGVPGLVQFVTVGSGPIRGMREMDNLLYVISGTSLYSVTESGVATLLGAGLTPGSNVLGMADSGTELIIVDGVKGFSYKPASGYAQIADVDFTPANSVEYINGFFLFDRIGTNEFFSSDALDGRSYAALFFDAADVGPDETSTVFSLRQQLHVGGEKTIEIWGFNPNTTGFPWNRYPGAVIKIGIAGPLARTEHKDIGWFVGSDRLLYRLDQSQPVPVSDPGVAAAWQSYSTVADATIFGMTWDTQEWIVVTFPTAGATWVYDATTTFWHERVSHDSSMVSYGRWRGQCYAKCYGKHLIGDAFTNQIGYLSKTAYDEYGNPIQGRLVSPTLHRDGETVFMNSLEVLMETGVGLTTGQGSDPMCVLDWSDDDGRSFRPFEMQASFGRIGEYKKRVRFTQLGSFNRRNYRFTITDPVKRVVMSAVPKATGGLKYS